MSQQNIEIVRRLIALIWNGSDFDAGRELVDPNVVVDRSASMAPDARVIQGREEAERFWREFHEAWASAQWEIDEYIDAGDQVVVLGRFLGRGAGSGVSVDAAVNQLFTLKGGLLVAHKLFQTRDEVLAAAGLPG